MQTAINLKQLSYIPAKGEHRVSVNVAEVADLRRLWDFAESLGYQPELIAMVYVDRVEVQLLLLQEYREPGTRLEFGRHDELIDRLIEVGVPDAAIRHSYGGTMALESVA